MPLLAAIVTASAVAVAVAACGGGGAPAVGAPPASRQTATERAATLRWMATTNQMWTRNEFSLVNQVTTGEARSAYLAQENQTRSDPGPAGRTPLRLASVSITVPCHHGAAATFVAYVDTNVFTLGQSLQPEALVFQRVGRVWKLAAIVNQSSGGVPGRGGDDRSGRRGARRLRGRPGPDAGPRRDRRKGDRRRGGTVRDELVLHGAGLVPRPVRHPDQAGPRQRDDAG